MIMGDGEKKYRKLRAASAKNDYRKKSQFFLEIHGKVC